MESLAGDCDAATKGGKDGETRRTAPKLLHLVERRQKLRETLKLCLLAESKLISRFFRVSEETKLERWGRVLDIIHLYRLRLLPTASIMGMPVSDGCDFSPPNMPVDLAATVLSHVATVVRDCERALRLPSGTLHPVWPYEALRGAAGISSAANRATILALTPAFVTDSAPEPVVLEETDGIICMDHGDERSMGPGDALESHTTPNAHFPQALALLRDDVRRLCAAAGVPPRRLAHTRFLLGNLHQLEVFAAENVAWLEC